MRHMLISYATKAERTAENRDLITAVFAELAEVKPADFRYLVIELDDGRFMHVVESPDDPAANPIRGIAAFKTFTANTADRHATPAETKSFRVVGSYRMGEEAN